VQPVVPRQDNRPAPGAERETPALYPVGCAGVIEQHEMIPDGRYVVVLRGVSRFRALRELPLVHGYRRVAADYAPFADDLRQEGPGLDPRALLEAVAAFAHRNGLTVELDGLRDLPPATLVNALAMSLPFGPTEKQALLECPGLPEREATLRSLLAMGPATEAPGSDPTPPVVN